MAPGKISAKVPIPEPHRLLAYVAELELEVDRLRKQGSFMLQEVRVGLRRIKLAAGRADAPNETEAAIKDLMGVLDDLNDPPGYHPAHDQVVPIAIRAMATQIYRAQRRLTGNSAVTLKLELEVDHVDWFAGRLRHILENLFSNALRYHDPDKSEAWLLLGVRASNEAYGFRVLDNGIGLPAAAAGPAFELLSRAAPVRETGIGVGLQVVRMLVEQSGGTLTASSEEGRGTEIVLTLPRYDLTDFLL